MHVLYRTSKNHNNMFSCCCVFAPNFSGSYLLNIWYKIFLYIWTANTVPLNLSNYSLGYFTLNILIIRSYLRVFIRVQTLEGFHVWSPAMCSVILAGPYLTPDTSGVHGKKLTALFISDRIALMIAVWAVAWHESLSRVWRQMLTLLFSSPSLPNVTHVHTVKSGSKYWREVDWSKLNNHVHLFPGDTRI